MVCVVRCWPKCCKMAHKLLSQRLSALSKGTERVNRRDGSWIQGSASSCRSPPALLTVPHWPFKSHVCNSFSDHHSFCLQSSGRVSPLLSLQVCLALPGTGCPSVVILPRAAQPLHVVWCAMSEVRSFIPKCWNRPSSCCMNLLSSKLFVYFLRASMSNSFPGT